MVCPAEWVDDVVVVVRPHKEVAVDGLSSITTIGIGNSHNEVGVGLRKSDTSSGIANERCDLPHLHRQAPHLVRAQITMEVLVLRIQGRHRRPRKGPSNILSDLPLPVDGSKSEGPCFVFSHPKECVRGDVGHQVSQCLPEVVVPRQLVGIRTAVLDHDPQHQRELAVGLLAPHAGQEDEASTDEHQRDSRHEFLAFFAEHHSQNTEASTQYAMDCSHQPQDRDEARPRFMGPNAGPYRVPGRGGEEAEEDEDTHERGDEEGSNPLPQTPTPPEPQAPRAEAVACRHRFQLQHRRNHTPYIFLRSCAFLAGDFALRSQLADVERAQAWQQQWDHEECLAAPTDTPQYPAEVSTQEALHQQNEGGISTAALQWQHESVHSGLELECACWCQDLAGHPHHTRVEAPARTPQPILRTREEQSGVHDYEDQEEATTDESEVPT
mmetsp:Transcript_132056/g.422553  ORF Transcript_132056/g.422553 Transcript_132056/m.422553 type:complete len:439 (-) Transcript_132056:245-1561(-)